MQVQQYLQGVQTEFKRISWPTVQQSWALTGLVILLSLLIAAYLGALDQVFTWILENVFLS